ncbi:zinc dependent phospholipase C family protein [Alteromonas gilva]|uniref:Zinc dependent phospholipase C family protein n=1 Tax=Alteromonas gilva TaxID=2987522 RepID=A0ABT5L652_9ALTE|nr:zinc dependent phospholipase C family protein [Alteromonas gilva]MDC8832501.1 zinc dependent phospholipase C family protein [Alteromonas gilva]
MPKEVVHWKVAEKVYKSLIDKPKLKEQLEKQYNTYLLGAVFHDALYYYSGENSNFTKIPDALHSSEKEDSFNLVRAFLDPNNYSCQTVSSAGLAFCIGFASHIFTDKNFHPMIYFFTGDYYSENKQTKLGAVLKHRELESKLDLHVESSAHLKSTYDLNIMVEKGLSELESTMKDTIKLHGYNLDLKFSDINSCYKNYALARKIYTSKLASKALSFLCPILPKSVEDVLSLSYFKDSFNFPLDFKTQLAYQNPVTGDICRDSVEQLLENSVNETLQFLDYFLESEMEVKTGPSLETGIPNTMVSQMKYFHPEASF